MKEKGAGALGRRSLHEEITSEIREMILEGALRPGAKVPEKELAEQLEVSRTPLREALKALSVEGLVTLVANRGATISVVTREQFEELLPVMAVLEQLGGESLCSVLATSDRRTEILDDLEALHAEIITGFEERDDVRYRKANKDFHERLIRHGGNTCLLEIYGHVLARMHMGRFLLQKTEESWRQAAQDHEKIMQAIRECDGPRTGILLRRHAEGTVRNVVLRALEQQT
ncbi:GntR family transcriptional regulator [Allosediminivita pacifica]|uniref:GntR family transcriptional regulator n=2 Tax=Allosediminivita pacifica TaxID=1267769 RepID=A0A2T6A046_9RHOB|nr:GntR family transcriptional regulator [Allosediminivita pacifica]PTX37177.1 GntR family transcriptional regulator [Allosediminivita pacifica]